MPPTASRWISRKSAIRRKLRSSTTYFKAGNVVRLVDNHDRGRVPMFKRLANLIRGFFGLFVSGLERQNPEALLEVETENLRMQIAQYNQGLASHAGLCERLM